MLANPGKNYAICIASVQSKRQVFNMAVFCAAPGANVTHKLIGTIEYFNVPVWPSATAYETLRLPSWKSHAAHVANHAALVAALGPTLASGFVCGQRKTAAVLLHRQLGYTARPMGRHGKGGRRGSGSS